MPAASIIDLYTSLLAWYMYEAMWSFITGTGLVMLPFLVAIIKTVVEDSEKEKKVVRQFVRTLEFRIYSMLAVMVFCAQPTIILYTTNLEYTHLACVSSEDVGSVIKTAERIEYGNTNTNADGYADHFQSTLNGGEVKMPLWWYWFGKLAHAATLSLKFELPCNPDFKTMADSISKIDIDKPVLRDEVLQFHRDCYKPSALLFARERKQRDFEQSNFLNDDSDYTWIGSRYFLNTAGYYDQHRAETPVTEFFWQEERDAVKSSQELAGDRGFPYCNEWWEPNFSNQDGLRSRLLDYIRSQPGYHGECESCWGATFRNWSDRFLGTELQREKEDFLLKAVLASDANMTQSMSRSNNTSGIWGGLSNIAANAGLFWDRIAPNKRAEGMAIKGAAPIVQAILLALFVMFLPMLMTAAMFDIGKIMVLTIAYITFIFWGYLFALAHYFESFFVYSLVTAYDDVAANHHGAFSMMTGGDWSDDSKLSIQVVQIISRYLYLILPIVFSGFMGLVGYQIGSGLPGIIDSLSSGSRSAAGKGGKGVEGMVKRGR